MSNFQKESPPPTNLNPNEQASQLARQKNFDLLRGDADEGAIVGDSAGGAKESGSINAKNLYIDGSQVLIAASQDEMEGAESVGVGVTPARQHYHPGHPKVWGYISATGGVNTDYNVASASQLATGHYRVVFGISLTTSVYAVTLSAVRTACRIAVVDSTSAGQFEYKTYDATGAAADSSVCFSVFDVGVDS